MTRNGIVSTYLVGLVLLLSISLSLSFSNRASKSTCSLRVLRRALRMAQAPKNSHPESGGDFEVLKSLDERIDSLTSRGTEYLGSFWNSTLNSFVIDHTTPATRPSVVSSCLSLEAILADPAQWSLVAQWAHASAGESKISLKRLVDSLRSVEWKGDPFSTPVLIRALASVVPAAELREDAAFNDAVQVVLSQRARLSLHRSQATSTYFRYLNMRALLELVDTNVYPMTHPIMTDILFALERSNMIASDALCRQISYYNAGDAQEFDVVEMAFNLAIYIDTSSNIAMTSLQSNRGTLDHMVSTNKKLVKMALKIVFGEQNEDGTWDKGEPIESGKPDEAPGLSRGPRDIGNSYVSSIDLLGSLVRALAGRYPHLLAPYLDNLERSVEWAEANVLQDVLAEHCDPYTGQCYGRAVAGWRSDHLGTGTPVAWCTAQVFYTLCESKKLVRFLLSQSILNEFGGTPASPMSSMLPGSREWSALMDAELQFSGQSPTTLKAVIEERTLQPLQMKELSGMASLLSSEKRQELSMLRAAAMAAVETDYSGTGGLVFDDDISTAPFSGATDSTTDFDSATDEGIHSDAAGAVTVTHSGVSREQPNYSMILFGPPGTAKTTICTSMASYLGWNFLSIDTAKFLADGMENVAARMTYIFDRLKSLDRTIILFDEVEEFCLDRENPSLSMESRMLTTAMLTQLNDLRRQQRSVFLVATNRIRSFDAAVTRPGRFDMLLFVGTPSLAAREARLIVKLQATQLPPSEVATAALEIAAFMRREWEPHAHGETGEDAEVGGLRFFTFAESERFLTVAVDFAMRGTLSEQSLMTQYKSQLSTATIRGTVRDDYIVSEQMSRL